MYLFVQTSKGASVSVWQLVVLTCVKQVRPVHVAIPYRVAVQPCVLRIRVVCNRITTHVASQLRPVHMTTYYTPPSLTSTNQHTSLLQQKFQPKKATMDKLQAINQRNNHTKQPGDGCKLQQRCGLQRIAKKRSIPSPLARAKPSHSKTNPASQTSRAEVGQIGKLLP